MRVREVLRRYGWRAAIGAVVLTLTASAAAWLLLRHIAVFLTFDPMFEAIFAQLSDADVRPPWLLTLLLSFAYCLPAARWSDRSRGCLIGACALGVLVWAVLLAVSLLLASVNAVMFADVLFSLLDILLKGGLGGL